MSDFTEPQRSIIKDRSIKLRTYLTEEEVQNLIRISLTDGIPTPTNHGLVEDVMTLTGSKNLTWSGRIERIKSIQLFIHKYSKNLPKKCECCFEENGHHSCGECNKEVSADTCKEQDGNPLCERCNWLMS